jgi:hypothetical protein
MAAANLTEFVTASARNWSKGMADNVTKHNALLRYLQNGRIVTANGGRVIDEAIIYPTNPNTSIKWYSGYDTFSPPTTSEVLDAAEFQWKQLGAFIAISGLEKLQNSGEGRRYDLARARLEQVQALLSNTLGAAIYNDGTVSNQIGGLQQLVADDPTAAGVVGGINQQTYSFWRNQTQGAMNVVLTSATIKAAMNALYLKCLRGQDKPTVILADNYLYSTYWASLQEQARFTDAKTADAGFDNLKYKSAQVLYDYQAPAGHMYYLNLSSLFFKKAPGELLEVGSARTIQNADYDVIPIFMAGNLTVNNRSLNGVLLSDPTP